MCRFPAMIVFGELRREAIVRFVELVQYGCFESFPFRQNFVIFVRQITDTELPVSMYITKTPIDMLTFDPQF